jgi:hypothetical protein
LLPFAAQPSGRELDHISRSSGRPSLLLQARLDQLEVPIFVQAAPHLDVVGEVPQGVTLRLADDRYSDRLLDQAL